jgi:drug/metabolite transporter (DMT)-like permease
VLGNGIVTYAQQTVSSSLAALSIATAPLWMAVFSSLWGHHIAQREWLGLLVGLAGITLLNVKGGLSLDPLGALLVMLAAALWSFGSIWSKYLDMPKGFMASAMQMLLGGVMLLLLSLGCGETWPQTISMQSWLAFAYLVLFGSIIAYSAFMYLVQTVRPMLASSNTFVNPVVAFAMGIAFAHEQVTVMDYLALAIILLGVFLILTNTENNEQKTLE